MNDDFGGAIRYNTGGFNLTTVIAKTFGKMAVGLLVTAIVAYLTFASGLYISILSNTILTIGIALAELFVVLYLSTRAAHMSNSQMSMWFYLYAILNGISMSYIFAAFNIGSIFTAFLCTSLMFAAAYLYGTTTKKDLTSLGSVGIMLLVGIAIATLLNTLFFHNAGLDLFMLYAGLVVFAGITAYDMQKIKEYSENVGLNNINTVNSLSTLFALEIYLDFINIFIRILAITNNSRDN